MSILNLPSTATPTMFLRLARVVASDPISQTSSIQMLDRADSRVYVCSMPNPYPNGEHGIFSVPNKDAIVLVDFSYQEAPYIVSLLSTPINSRDTSVSSNTSNVRVGSVRVPYLSPGETLIKGFDRAGLLFDKSGAVTLSHGNSYTTHTSSNIKLESLNIQYSNLSSSKHASGEIRRDMRIKFTANESSVDHLSDVSYEERLTQLCRNPNASAAISARPENGVQRNPPLTESRATYYEFARDYGVGSLSLENSIYNLNTKNPQDARLSRSYSRADVLNLNPAEPNNLLEVVHGTLVDFYGNVLDINRNSLEFDRQAKTSEIGDGNTPSDLGSLLKQHSIQLRRSIKYHIELNAKKDIDGDQLVSAFKEPDSISGDTAQPPIGHSHSRWYMDVDGEGLTKINIPASSNSGNIPLLARHTNSYLVSNPSGLDLSSRQEFTYRDESGKDIVHSQFGTGRKGKGVTLTNAQSFPSDFGGGSKFLYSTAYHDITFNDILGITYSGGNLGRSGTYQSVLFNNVAPISTAGLSNTGTGGNAGGRSLHANFDGSVELNIGRDNIDNKSLVLDTSGSLVARIGKDRNDNSVITQTDGNITMVMGGSDGEGAVTNPQFRLYIKCSSGTSVIEINDGEIYISSAPNKNVTIHSENNLILDAKGHTLVNGETVGIYGKVNNGNPQFERHIERSGRII